MTQHIDQTNFKFQRIVVIVGVLLFAMKMLAWFLTQSVAIYSDAMESVVNVISSFLGLYSLFLVMKPKDKNHPYGHGKVEFLSSAVEGVLISIAGVVIIIEAFQSLFVSSEVKKLDFGLILIVVTAVLNYIVGWIAVQKGRKNASIALVSTGKHLMTDTYSTVGVIIGLALLYLTNWHWVDASVALIFSGVIIYTGYTIIRESIGGIMDETDEKLLQEMIDFLNEKRRLNWIDLHNLRIIKYGSKLHLDLHMTLPFYYSVKEAHDEVEHIDFIMNEHFGERVELFIHVDPCQPFSCHICQIETCSQRTSVFKKAMHWNRQNIAHNSKHIYSE